jgi:hypothetical protein
MSDAPEQQRAAPAPAGMRRIPFPLESYQHPSEPLSSKRLLNLMAEAEPGDARTAAALVPTPGLVGFMQVGYGPIVALNDDIPGLVYVVSGNRFYRVRQTGEPNAFEIDDLGYVGVPPVAELYEYALLVTIAVGPTAAVVCVPPNAFTCGHAAADLMEQLGGTFEAASSVAYLDGYFAFTGYPLANFWFISRLFDPSDFDALDFAYADALNNILRRVIAHRGEFWLIGDKGFEVCYDSGNADFPFRRRPGAVIWVGSLNPKSVTTLDGSVWWLGYDGIVYRSLSGYQIKRVSSHAVEAWIRSTVGIRFDALAYRQEGHSFYALTLDNRTMVYDVSTGMWHDRASDLYGLGAWRALSVAVITQSPIFGDRVGNWLYKLEHGSIVDAGVKVLRQAVFPPLWAGTARAFCSRIEVEMEVGTKASNGIVTLEWSDDGGTTWNGLRDLSSGIEGQLRQRAVATRLGSFRQRVFRLTTRNSAPTYYAMDANIVAGNH